MQSQLERRRVGEEGLSIVEVAVALGILSMIMISAGFAILAGVEHRREVSEETAALHAVRDLLSEIQEVANLPQDLGAGEGIGAIYRRYHQATVTIPDVPGGRILIECFANEATVPTELGGPQDLNYEGDASDDLGNAGAGSDLKSVPLRLTAVATIGGNLRTILTVHRIITKTAD